MAIDDTNGAPGGFFTEQKMTNALHFQDGQEELQQQLTMCGRRLVVMLSVGLVVAALAVYGQNALTAARPIFPFIQQTYVVWQLLYTGLLILSGLAWVHALLQRINGWQECWQRLTILRRINQQKSRHAISVEEARRTKERTDAIMLQTSAPTIKNARRRKGSSRTDFNNAADPCVEKQDE